MDEHILKHHFLKQLIHHQQGADHETLVQKTAESAGVDPDTCRGNILDWINDLTVTGHLKHKGDVITAADVRHLQAIHNAIELEDNAAAVWRDPELAQFFLGEAAPGAP